jgi:hypothetical protein
MKPTRSQYILPEGSARRFTPAEEAKVQEATNKWMPDMFQEPGTPALNTLSSPTAAGLTAAALAFGGASAVGKLTNRPAAGLLVGVPLAIIVGLIAAERKNSKNLNTVDKIRRYPPDTVVAKRDLDADKSVSAKMIYGKGVGGFDTH